MSSFVWLNRRIILLESGCRLRPQWLSPGICPVTGTKAGMGSGTEMPPPPSLACLPAVPSPDSPGSDSGALYLNWEGGMLTSSHFVAFYKSWHFTKADILGEPHTLTLSSLLNTQDCRSPAKRKQSLACKKLWGGCSNVSGVATVTGSPNFLCGRMKSLL